MYLYGYREFESPPLRQIYLIARPRGVFLGVPGLEKQAERKPVKTQIARCAAPRAQSKDAEQVVHPGQGCKAHFRRLAARTCEH